jgi:RNA ligase
MKAKLLTRDQFREGVFARDRNTCVLCSAPAVDAHHIIERKLWVSPDELGGYFMENGASVCEEHHRACERTDISVDVVREACGIRVVVLPQQLDPDLTYDKWGNVLLPGDRLVRGPIFDDRGVQKNLAHKMDQVVYRMKYPRTPHAPWSDGIGESDRAIYSMSIFEGRRVIVTEKMDGENTTIYRDGLHARSLDGRSHPSQAWVRGWAASIQNDLPENWRVCGENLYAVHSITYEGLPSYFMGFSMWDERNVCQAWDETVFYFQALGICHVPVLYDGVYNEALIRGLMGDRGQMEGYVIRVADAFHYTEFHRSLAKYVRANHVTTTEHWKSAPIVPNGLA